MDIPLPEEVPVALIPTPPKPTAVDQSIALPRAKITLKPSPTLRLQPLPPRTSIPLPPLAPAPLYCNIPMPDEQPSPTAPAEDPNRYSPSTVLSDDEPTVTSNTISAAVQSNRFLVLGKAQAKKRLLAFSTTKQAGGAGLTFNLPKKVQTVKQNLAKGFDPTTEGEPGSATVPATKKKIPLKKVVKEDRARAVITAIEEIKREELLMRGVLRIRLDPSTLGDMTAPVPLIGQPIVIDHDQVDISHKKERDDDVGESGRDRKSDDRRKEKRVRHKSDHRSRDKEKERQSKPKEKADQPPPTSPLPAPQVPVLPVSWKEFRSSGMSFDQIRRSKIELESKKVNLHYRKSKEEKQKQDLDFGNEIYNPFDYPSRYMEPFKAEGSRQRSTQYTQDMIRYTECKPVISYCLNPNVLASRYRTRAEVMKHAKPASVAIIECLVNSQEDVVEVEDSFEEKSASRSWFLSADKFIPPVLYEEVPVKSSEFNSVPSSQTTAGDSGMYDGPVSADSQDDKMSSQVSTSDAFVSSGVVLSKWDSDYEEGEVVKDFEDKQCTPDASLMEVENDLIVKKLDCADSDVISASDVCSADHTVKEEKDKHSGMVIPEEKSGSDVMSPDQSGLHTRATSSGADSDPNLQNEYEEFMKSVTAGDEGDEVADSDEGAHEVAGEARTDFKTGIAAGNKSESDGRSEANAEHSLPKSAKKKVGPGYKPRKIRSKESRAVKDKRKRKLKERKKKKRRRSTSTSSSSSEDSSDEDEDVEEGHSKKAKKRKRKIRASKKKKYHKKTKKRRRKSSSDEESTSSESSTSSSSTSSEDSSSSSDHKKQAKKRKKPIKSKEKKSGQKIKKKKTSGSKSKENVDEVVESAKPLKTIKEKKKNGSKVKVNHSTSEIKNEQSVSSNVECLPELNLVKAKEEPQNSIPVEKSNDKNSAKNAKKKSKRQDSLESDDEEETRSRKSGKKRRKHSKSVSPVERKHHRSPSSSPDRNATSKPIRNSDGYNYGEHKSCENGNSQTGSMDNGKKSGKGERKHKAADEDSDNVNVDEQDVTRMGLAESIGASEVDLPEPNRGDQAVPTQLEQEEVDKLKNAAADVWENDSQLEESLVNSSEGNEWERESPIVEKLPGRNKEVSPNWYEPGKDLASPANVEADTAENALHPPSLSDDLDQEVAKRSLRELKYLREVIKFEVGNEPSKQDSQSDGETEKDVAIFRRLNDAPASLAVCNNDKVTSFVQDIFKEPFLLASVPLPDDTPQESLLASELYSPGQEEDTKSTRSNSPETLTLEPDSVSSQPTVADDSDMSLGSTCSNQDIDVPIQRELLANQWNDFETRTTNFCFPLDNIPLPPSASDLVTSVPIEEIPTPISSGTPDADTDSNKLLRDQTMLAEIAVPQANSKKLSKEIQEAPVTKAKHVITVKLLPTAERLQSKAIGVGLKTDSRNGDTQTGWIPVVVPSPVTACTPSVVKAKRPSRWSDGPVVTPVEAVVTVQETVFKQDHELTTSCGIDIFADQSNNVPVAAALNMNVNVVEHSSFYIIPESVKIEEAMFTEQPAYQETKLTNLQEDDLSQRSCVSDKEVVAPVIPGYKEDECEDKGAVLGGGEELNRGVETASSEQDAVRRSDGSDGAGSLGAEGGRRSERRDREDSRRRDSRERERDARKRDVNGSRSRDSRDRRDGRDDRRRSQTDRSRSSAKDGEVRGPQEGRPGSPRRKSSEGTERRRSPNRDEKNPNKDDRNKSPSRDARRRSPARDNRHRSPARDGRVRSPNRDARNRSPNRDGRNRSPNKDARNRSPNRDGRNSSPNREARNRSPNRDGRNRSPNRDGRNRSPSRDGRNRSPSRDGRNRSPGRDGRNKSPGRDGRNRSPGRDGRYRSPGRDGRNRSPGRDGRNRSPGRDGRRRDARKRSPNKDSRDDSRRGDVKSASRDRDRGRPRGGSSPQPPLSSIPLPDLQLPGGHGRNDDCNSMDMEFSSPVSNFSPLVGLKRSLADSTTITDEDLKLAHSGLLADNYGSINPDYYATVKVESNHHSGMHNDSPNYQSELSPKRLSLDERLELELGLRLSPKHEPQPPSVAGLPAREAQYHHQQQQQQHWQYQGGYTSQADQAQLQPHQLHQPHYAAPNPDAYAGHQAGQFAPAPNAYFGQPPPHVNSHGVPPAPACADNKYVPELPQHSALRPVPMCPRLVAAPQPEPYSALRPVPLVDIVFPMPSIPPPDPLPVPRPVTAPVSPARTYGQPSPITVLSPLGYVQPAGTAAAQLDLQTHQFYPKVNVCSDLTKEPVLQLVYTGQLKEAVVEPALPSPAQAKTHSPECVLVDKKALQKKAAREKLRKEKDEKRRLVEIARLLKMERFAKYKEAIQEEGDTLRRSITLNLEEIRLNLGSQSVSRASTSRTKPRTSPAVKVVPLPEATKGILISIGFREKPVCGPEAPRKSVMFADGVRPGDGSSPSAGEDLPSPVHFVPKKKLHKKKKKIKVHVIRQVLFEESDEEVDLPPPPPPGSPPPHLKPFAFPGPDQGRMYPQPPNGFALAGREVRANEPPAEWVPEPAECSSYPDLKTMKLLAYHQAMMTIKQHVAVWQAGLSPLSRGKPPTPPQPPAPAPAPAYDLPNGFPPPQMGFGGAAKTMYAHERIPVVSCSPGPAYCHLLPPPPLPQSPQLRNPPPPPPPNRNKGYRWPP